MTCYHKWDMSGELVVLEESDRLCLVGRDRVLRYLSKGRVTEELGQKDIDGDLVNIKLQSQIIRTQTQPEKEDAVKQ